MQYITLGTYIFSIDQIQALGRNAGYSLVFLRMRVDPISVATTHEDHQGAVAIFTDYLNTRGK